MPFLKDENSLPKNFKNQHMKVELFNAFTREKKNFEVSKNEIEQEMEEEKMNFKALQLNEGLNNIG